MKDSLTIDIVQQLLTKIDHLTDMITVQTSKLDEQTSKIEEQNATILKLTESLEQALAENVKLKEQLNKNSKNSSKPPSSDGLKKPETNSLRKPSKKSQGAQKGHIGKGLSITKQPDAIVEHQPKRCLGCIHAGTCISCGVADQRYEVDIQIDTKVILHQLPVFECKLEHNVPIQGVFPSNIKSTIQYGNALKALAISLNTIGMVSISRTHEILSGVFGVPISTGTIHSMVRSCAGMLEDTVKSIRQRVIQSSIVHFDETGTRVASKTMWVHNASNEEYAYLTVEEKRGSIGMNSSGVLPYFKGIAVHDCWKSYWKYPTTHAVCCAHLLRELTGIIENYPKQTWAQKMIGLLMRMKIVRDKAVNKGKEHLSYYHLLSFKKEYLSILKTGRDENPIKDKIPGKRGRQPKGKIRALIERFAEYKEEVCLFTENFNVPFDNNLAERDVRMVKVKTKVSGCFRTKEGTDNFITIMSYIKTANKQGFNSFLAISKALAGQSDFIFE